jgi:hypothetical protein
MQLKKEILSQQLKKQQMILKLLLMLKPTNLLPSKMHKQMLLPKMLGSQLLILNKLFFKLFLLSLMPKPLKLFKLLPKLQMMMCRVQE